MGCGEWGVVNGVWQIGCGKWECDKWPVANEARQMGETQKHKQKSGTRVKTSPRREPAGVRLPQSPGGA